MSARRVIAVIPAAGRGRRMGQLKQLLPLGGSTMMETVIATAVASEVDGVVVVVNDDVRPVAERHASERCRIALNPDPDSDMLKSIQIGWREAVDAFGIGGNDGIAIMPADQPQQARDVVADLLATFRSDGRNVRAVIATYGRSPGHPSIYPQSWIAETESWPTGRGLNELANLHARDVIPAGQPFPPPIDVNTPADYDRAAEIHNQT